MAEHQVIGLTLLDIDEFDPIAHLVRETLQQTIEDHTLSLEINLIEDVAEIEDNVIAMLAEGVTCLVTIGEEVGRTVEAMSRHNESIQFITVGHKPQPENLNVTGIIYQNKEENEVRQQLAAEVNSHITVGGPAVWQIIRQRFLGGAGFGGLVIPLLAIVTALLIGAIFIAAFDAGVWESFQDGLFVGIGAAFSRIFSAYAALLEGAFGNPVKAIEGLFTFFRTGDDTDFIRAVRPLTDSLRISVPYIFTGLAVALAFRCGLFNIGGEGQYFIGGLATTYVGYAVTGLPIFIHLPLALIAGFAGGAFWAAISGFLKARTGAHEVITTIMLNYIAFRVADFLLQVNGPMARPNDNRPVSPEVLPTAWLPQLFPNNSSVTINFGLIIALIAVFAVSFLLFKTTLGFEFRTVGANPRAARTAGVNVERSYVVVMALSGGLAGLAGSHDILGVTRFMPNAFFAGYGFDAIAIALIGRNTPVGVLLAALLFGFLRSGAQRMQFAGVPIDIISIVQGLIIVFIAAPELIRLLYRLRSHVGEGQQMFTQGWGGA